MAAAEMVEEGEAEVRGRNRLLKQIFVWVLDLIGPTGVYIAGGILILLLTPYLVQRVKDPPVITTLQPATSG
jgi:hypothetical protein